jgi:hypothetical protein
MTRAKGARGSVMAHLFAWPSLISAALARIIVRAQASNCARVGQIDRALLDRHAVVLNSHEILKTLTRESVYRRGTFLLECFAFTVRVDYDNGLHSIARVDRALEPIMKHAWRGNTLLFPILLDPTSSPGTDWTCLDGGPCCWPILKGNSQAAKKPRSRTN